MKATRLLRTVWFLITIVSCGGQSVERFSVFESAFQANDACANPYTDLTAEAILTGPNGTTTRTAPLFWDGGLCWKFRFAPDQTGRWTWRTRSRDSGLNAKSGAFEVVDSNRQGSVRPMTGFPLHFQRQDGSPFWFLGDTAWALYTDQVGEKHDRSAALRHIEVRAAQGFNVLHSMLLSEAGWGNQGGPPFHNLAREEINPAYWQEVDHRLAYANRHGIVCGLALAWGDKGRQEPFAWHQFPSLTARKRYARYVAARYSAYEVYFLVSGEWHAEIRARRAAEDAVRNEFMEIGDALQAADPHHRMIAIHPMTRNGSVREFNQAHWMAFGDYQQNYQDLHARLLQSRAFQKPVVNSEYGYFLRDQNGDGTPDKDNSTSLEAMRHATWDIVMTGSYLVTGFGTTYFGGNRDPGSFDLDAAKNQPWEHQLGHVKRLFTSLEWWKLAPHDDWVQCPVPRGPDRREFNQTAPPATAFWCLAEPGRQYLLYVRGLKEPVILVMTSDAPWQTRQFNPRTGEFKDIPGPRPGERFKYEPPTAEDWVVLSQELVRISRP